MSAMAGDGGLPQPEIGKLIEHAMDLIEFDGPTLRYVLPKTYARPSLDLARSVAA